MSFLFVSSIILLSILLLILLGFGFYEAFTRFKFLGVILFLLGLAVLVIVVILTTISTVNLGEMECKYIPEINEINFSTGQNYTFQKAYHSCYFDFFGSKSASKTFFIKDG